MVEEPNFLYSVNPYSSLSRTLFYIVHVYISHTCFHFKMLVIHKIVINMLRIQYDPHSFIIPWSNIEIKMEANGKQNILRLVLSKQMVTWWLKNAKLSLFSDPLD